MITHIHIDLFTTTPLLRGVLNVPPLPSRRGSMRHLDHLVHQAFGRRAALLGGLGAGVDGEDQQPLVGDQGHLGEDDGKWMNNG